MISTLPPAATATPGRPDETQGAHRAPIDGGGDPAVQLICQLHGGEFVGTTVSGRPTPAVRCSRRLQAAKRSFATVLGEWRISANFAGSVLANFIRGCRAV